MKVFLDDMRTPPAGWTLAKTPEETVALLQKGDVTHLSLDHDLGDDIAGTGYDVLLWLEEEVALRGFVPPVITIHSANPPARMRMEQASARIVDLARQTL